RAISTPVRPGIRPPRRRDHMRKLLIVALGVIAFAGSAQAQLGPGSSYGPSYGPGYRGNISPYLNLLRGRNTGIDYYLGTRSEFQRRQDAREFRDDISDLERREGAFGDESLPQTPVQSGTPTTFGSTLGYYNNRQNYLAPTVARMGAAGGAVPAQRG